MTKKVLLLSLLSVFLLGGCATERQSNAAAGAGIGAVGGALVGGLGGGEDGALIGAGVGAVVGGLVGSNAQTRSERERVPVYDAQGNLVGYQYR